MAILNRIMNESLFFNTVFEHFNRRGVKFTLDEVARSLKISKKTIYKLYGRKEEVINGTICHFFAEHRRAELSVLNDESLSLLEKIRKILLLFPYNRVEIAHITALRVNYPDIYRTVWENMDDSWDNVDGLLNNAFERKILKPFKLSTFHSVLQGVFQEVMTMKPSDKERTMEECVDFFIRGYYIG